MSHVGERRKQNIYSSCTAEVRPPPNEKKGEVYLGILQTNIYTEKGELSYDNEDEWLSGKLKNPITKVIHDTGVAGPSTIFL